MNIPRCPSPLPFGDLVDYLLGELSAGEEKRVEEHLFACASCAARLETVAGIGRGLHDLVAQAHTGGVVNREFIETARRRGLTFREYVLRPDLTVSCKAGPEDFVLVRLAAHFGSAADMVVDVDFRDLERDVMAPRMSRAAEVDREADEILIILPGEVIRRYPRSLWTMRAHGKRDGQETEFGTFIMDHTP